MNTKNVFEWAKNDSTAYSVKFTEEGKSFMASMISCTIDEDSYLKCTENESMKFLSDYEKTYEIHCFRPDDKLKDVILRIIEAFYVNVIMYIKDTVDIIRENTEFFDVVDKEDC